MKQPVKSQEAQRAYVMMVVLTTLLGMQLLRSLLPYLRPLLGERLGWSTINSALFALALFALAFLAGPLNRWLGSGLMILITGFVIGLSRIAAQLWSGDPIVKLIFTMTGVIAFLLFLPTAAGVAAGTSRKASTLALGMLAGLALDLALNGAFYSYDLIWQRGIWPTLIILFLVLGQWWTLFLLLRHSGEGSARDAPFARAIAWALIGPFLFLQLLQFANIGWATTSSGWPFLLALFWLLLAHVLGVAIWLLPRAGRFLLAVSWALALVCGVFIFFGPSDPWITAFYLLFGQIALAGSLVSVLAYLGGSSDREGIRNISIAGGLGMILLVLFLFAYYAVYDLPLPFANQGIPLIALFLAALLGSAALLNNWRNPPALDAAVVRPLSALLLLTLLLPLALRLTEGTPTSTKGADEALHVMTYNLHYGANVKGALDLEALAQVIESEQPDIVGLQEVSRGWVINGSVDMLAWLAKRLQMEPVFGPAADGQWGNALLTRLPVAEQATYPLPTEDLLLRRSFIHARLQGAGGEDIDLIVTHYHNPDDGGEIRVLQSERILEFVQELPNTLMMGDLNAQHGTPEIDKLLAGGFADALDLAGVEPGHSYPVPGPLRRIDYLLVSAGWRVDAAVVPYSEASDHLPVAAAIRWGR